MTIMMMIIMMILIMVAMKLVNNDLKMTKSFDFFNENECAIRI